MAPVVTLLWSAGGDMRKIITLIRAHGLLNRAHRLLNRAHGLLNRAHGLVRLNNYFPHVTSGAPYTLYFMVLNKEWMFPKLELYSYHINSNPAWVMNYSKQVRGAWLDLGVAGWGTVFAVYVL